MEEDSQKAGNLRIAYDARFLQPRTRHWGVGAFIDNIVGRLGREFCFKGLSQDFPGASEARLKTWPSVSRLNRLVFEASPLFASDFEAYWGTTHYLPQLIGRPSVLTVHDMLLLNHVEDGGFAQFLAWRFRSSLSRARKIVVDSRSVADELMAEFPELTKRIEVVLLGCEVPSKHSDGNPMAVELPSSPYMTMLGCHRPRKNLGLALATISKLREEAVEVELLITGDIHPSFRGMMRRYTGCARHVSVLPRRAIFSLLSRAVCLLFPSRYEGFGFPLLEAMAAGCPVVALDTPINREIAGGAAWLLPEDPREWAAACKRLLASEAVREEMKERGLENLRRFSWDKTAISYGAIFKEVAR